MKNAGIIYLLFVFVFGACNTAEESIDINQDHIYTIYQLNYDQNKDETEAIAYFRIENASGKYISLSGASNVKFNGEEMLTKVDVIADVTSYKLKFDGFVDGGIFIWRDLTGREFTNSVYIENSIAFKVDFDTISNSENYDFLWDGEPLEANETAELVLYGKKISDNRRFTQAQPGATNILLEEKLLKNFSVGEATAFLERKLEMPLQAGTSAGGLRKGVFIAKEIKIQVQ